MSEQKDQQPLVEICRSQNSPDNPGGQHTNGPAPFWIRFRGGSWRRFHEYRSWARLKRDLEELLSVESEEEE